MGDNNQDKVKRKSSRLLTYRDIKRAIGKAGPLPEDPSDNLAMLCWIAKADLGRGCLPCLRRWYVLRDIMTKKIEIRHRRRGRTRDYTENDVQKLAKEFQVRYPGKRKMRPGIKPFYRSHQLPISPMPLAARLNNWKRIDGPVIAAQLKAWGFLPSQTRMTDHRSGGFWFASRHVIKSLRLPPMAWSRARDCIGVNYHIGTLPLPIP